MTFSIQNSTILNFGEYIVKFEFFLVLDESMFLSYLGDLIADVQFQALLSFPYRFPVA